MIQVYQNIGHIILMLLLLTGSAFFSGTETAFFSLSRRQINLLKKSKHKLQNLTARLLDKPRQLLGCLLFGNMMVNVLFYAAASVFTVRVRQQTGVTAAVFTACTTFISLVLFGEILPKSLAYANSRALSVITALPLLICMRIFTPIVSVFRFLVAEPIVRLLLGPARLVEPVNTDEFKSLVEASRKHGLITADENKLLTEVIELRFLKIRDCMQPRVDMVTCAVTDSSRSVRERMQNNHLTKLPVYDGTIDNIIGIVYFRQLLLEPDVPVKKLVRQVHFVPEQKTVESLLEFFRKAHTDIAIVVDEYGGIAGSICIEDIAEELFGPTKLIDGIEPIKQTGLFEYRLSGDLSIHDWAKVFDIDPAATRVSTIAGMVTILLGKIPKSGDVAYWKNLKFTIGRMRKHRIETLILTFEPIKQND